jgi:hypothetical protein
MGLGDLDDGGMDLIFIIQSDALVMKDSWRLKR